MRHFAGATASWVGTVARNQRSHGVIDDRDRARPTGGAAAHLDREATHREALRRQRFQIMQLLDVAIADLAAGLVAFPDQAGVACGEVFLLGVHERRIPTPAVGSGHAHAALEQIKRGLAAHAAALGDIIRAAVGRARAGIHEHDVERRERVRDARELGLHVACGRDIAVGEVPKVELDSALEAPVERHLVDRDRSLAAVHGRGEMPGRVEMGGVVRRQLDPLDRPTFALG